MLIALGLRLSLFRHSLGPPILRLGTCAIHPWSRVRVPFLLPSRGRGIPILSPLSRGGWFWSQIVTDCHVSALVIVGLDSVLMKWYPD